MSNSRCQTNNKAYSLRPRNQNTNHLDVSDPKSGAGQGVAGTGMRIQRTKSHRSRKRVANRERNKENTNPAPKKTILSWLVHCKVVKENKKVCYMDSTKKRAIISGKITKNGITCNCCFQEKSVWSFEKHAESNLQKPYNHIYLMRKKKKSLQECQATAWDGERERMRRRMFKYTADPSDDTCPVCVDGGGLICCSKCPSTYHPSCMNLKCIPRCDWLCPYCICKFCRSGCRVIYENLERSLGIKHDLIGSFSWRVIRRMDIGSQASSDSEGLLLENNSKVGVASMLMEEALMTITDRCSGIDMVQSIVYSRGSNLARIDYKRFYTFVLEKDDEIVAAALIRFPGGGIAELPFFATDKAYRGNGFCTSLMGVIESFLCKVEVKKLIMPSMAETADMWKRKYNFTEATKELEKEISSYNILMFHLSVRLYKDLSGRSDDHMERARRALLNYNHAPDEED